MAGRSSSPSPILFIATLFALAASTGCVGGGGDGGGGGSDGAPSDGGEPVDGAMPLPDAEPDAAPPADPFALPDAVPLADLRDAFGRARCAFDARCDTGFAGTEPTQCVDIAGDFAWHAETIERQVDLGRLDYDPTTMAECLAWLAERPCETVGRAHGVTDYRGGRDYFIRERDTDWMAFEPCRRALLGDGAAGDGCVHDLECASGTCHRNGDDCGTCAPQGGRCDEQACADDEQCDFDTFDCGPRVGEGEPCVNDASCTAELRCDRPGAELGTCVGLGPIGRECDDSNRNSGLCPLGSLCVRDVCEALDLRFRTAGEACSRDSNTAACRPDLACRSDDDGATYTCRAFTIGDDCGYAERQTSPLSRLDACAPDAVCDEAEVCAEPGQVGDICGGSRDCANALFCDRDSRTCQPRRGEGEVCQAYPAGSECAYPFNCVGSRLFGMDDGMCLPGAELGEACTGKEDCSPELSCNDNLDPPRCVFYANYGSSYFGCR